MKPALIIFVRNPELGKVKTRLAKTIGPEKALQVYLRLLDHTQKITKHLLCDKFVFYADYINDADSWDNNRYRKEIQKGEDLGERIRNAFAHLFAAGYTTVQVIGSDCYELTEEIIQSGFEKLAEAQVVIGPSVDGGYYLLGMQAPLKDLFCHKQWSTASVFADTVADIRSHSFSYALLPLLSDVDEAKDIPFVIR